MNHQRRQLAAFITAAMLIGAACSSSDQSNGGADPDTEPTVLSAADGAAARERLVSHGSAVGVSATSADAESSLAEDFECGEPYVPTAEEVAAVNADSDALAAEFDRFGVTYTRVTDDLGFVNLDYSSYEDVVIQSIVDSFWAERYPIEPIPQVELDARVSENDAIAAALDAVGVAYTRSTDASGWENLEWDYEDPTAREAADAVYAELYPPLPPSAADLEYQATENARLIEAFEAADVAYTLVEDELGWAWVQWNVEDDAINEQVSAIFEELYPVDIAIDPAVGCVFIEDDGLALDDGATVDDGVDETDLIAPVDPIGSTGEFTPEQIAQRDAEVTAMAAGFDAAGVTNEVIGESPWQSVIFDLSNTAATNVVVGVLVSRG